MNKLAIIQKPELQLINETKKLRDYSEVERLTISKTIVVSLLNKLGVGNKSNEKHHIEVIKFIANNKVYTPEEFEKAFNLAIEGAFNIDLLQQLNCIVVGKVMNEFRNYRKHNLKNYKHQMQIQLAQKALPSAPNVDVLFLDVLKDEFKNYKEVGKVNDMRNWLYDKLVDRNITVAEPVKKVLWKHTLTEIRKSQGHIRKRDRYSPEELKTKAYVIYKAKLIEQIFNNFTNIEQLLNKLK